MIEFFWGVILTSLAWVFALRWARRKTFEQCLPLLEAGAQVSFWDPERKQRRWIGRVDSINYQLNGPSTIHLQDESSYIEDRRIPRSWPFQ